jgi:hypothetical protein
MKYSVNRLLLLIIIAYNSFYAMEKSKESQITAIFNADNKTKPAIQALLKAFKLEATTPQEIVQATQAAWLRPADKERWQVLEDKYKDRKNELIPLLKNAQLVDEIVPAQKQYDYLIIMGALYERARKRTEYAVNLWDQGIRFKEIIVLGSERKLDPQQEPASSFAGTDQVPTTEYEMLKWVFNTIQIPTEMRQTKTTFINSPNTIDEKTGKVKRATTADSIATWLATQPTPGSCLVISNQPYIGYQDAVAKKYLPKTFSIQTCGEALDEEDRMLEILDALARWIFNA